MWGDVQGQAIGPVIDVSVPIQCLVEGSQLHMEGGESKAWEVGFYDPSTAQKEEEAGLKHVPTCTKDGGFLDSKSHRLAVRYFFRGALHQVRH